MDSQGCLLLYAAHCSSSNKAVNWLMHYPVRKRPGQYNCEHVHVFSQQYTCFQYKLLDGKSFMLYDHHCW